jgi:hypothetical protein
LKASEWLNRSQEENDPINSFSNSWMAFNNLYFPESGGPEREKIKNYILNNINPETAISILAAHENQITYLLSAPVIDMRGNGRDTEEYITTYHSSDSPVEKLKSILMVIYQVRCNLIHGQKSPARERDVVLCLNSKGIVNNVVEVST